MLKIYLARHGQDLDNVNGILNGRRDMPLSDLGISQANNLAGKISETNIHFDKIYASPLKRAYDTALLVSQKLKMSQPEVLENLIERDFGILTGKPHKDIKEVCGKNVLETETITYFINPDGAETFDDLITRGKKVIKFIQEKHKDGNILLVSHGDFGKMIYAAFYDLPWKEVLSLFHFGNADLVLLSPDSTPEDVHVFEFKNLNNSDLRV